MEDLKKKMGEVAFDDLCRKLGPDGPNNGAMARRVNPVWPY